MLFVPETATRGHQIHELTLQVALQRIDPDFHFDLGAKYSLWHPKINRWQGIFHRGKHITSMGREWLPEWNRWRLEPLDEHDGLVEGPGELMEIGWRETCENIARSWVPGVTWRELSRELNVDYKMFTGNPKDLAIPENKVPSIFNTVG